VVLWARSEGSKDRACAKVEDAATVVTELSELAGCAVVVEAISEEEGAKRELYELLADVLDEDTVLATTTSSLSVAALAAASGRPDRFGALHVFNPPDRMKLVELSFPPDASEATRRRLHALCEELGKTAVEVPDAAGFVVNKLLFPYLFDAVRLLELDGLEPEAIDTCMKLGAGHPMGPLALLDFVGLDVAAAIGESIGAEVPGRVRELMAEGRLGKKAGAGFYDYPPRTG
jgi:3-hydroxyacyl-CoA dehydrogenase